MVAFWQAALRYEVEHADPKGGFDPRCCAMTR
jgi:hypothetical protein